MSKCQWLLDAIWWFDQLNYLVPFELHLNLPLSQHALWAYWLRREPLPSLVCKTVMTEPTIGGIYHLNSWRSESIKIIKPTHRVEHGWETTKRSKRKSGRNGHHHPWLSLCATASVALWKGDLCSMNIINNFLKDIESFNIPSGND